MKLGRSRIRADADEVEGAVYLRIRRQTKLSRHLITIQRLTFNYHDRQQALDWEDRNIQPR